MPRSRQIGTSGPSSVRTRTRAVWEALEGRVLLSAAPTTHAPRLMHTTYEIFRHNQKTAQPLSTSAPIGLMPQQVRAAYAIDQTSFGGIKGDGSGRTIAIVDAFDLPTAQADLSAFDKRFQLPEPPSFKKLNQVGGTTLPGTDPAASSTFGGWEAEESLDLQWAHAVAPGASLLLVEANSSTESDLYTAAATAARQPGVVAVSMSFGSDESLNESGSDRYFVTPSGHGGVTFLAATGDKGSPGMYPAYSKNVVAVGGTRLRLGTGGAYGSETGWSAGGGGLSSNAFGYPFESEPSWQQSVQTTGRRSIPDVSMDADPSTGVAVYDSFNFGKTNPWVQFGGTSLSTPLWAGLIAVADQFRAQAGMRSLDGATQTLPRLYGLPKSDFHDITSGSNGSFSAKAGYDEVTGLGTPVANLLVPDLAGVTAPPAPSNDAFAAAAVLSGPTASASGTNAGATAEPGEPVNGTGAAHKTVWWSWTAPLQSGRVTISATGSDFAANVGVYTGASVTDLTHVTGGALSGSVTFDAVGGTTYFVCVDGPATGASTGTIALQLTDAPSNDDFAGAAPLVGTFTDGAGFNDNATAEVGEPNIAGLSGGQSVWWTWTAPQTAGDVTVTTAGTNFANVLGVYTGVSPDSLTEVASATSDAGNSSSVTFTAVPGTTFAIYIDSMADPNTGNTTQGTIQLHLTALGTNSQVVGRYVFYNSSAFDGRNPGATDEDDQAIATDKAALLPGQSATFANYTSYSKGINGIMIDVAGLPAGAAPTADDFTFLAGNDSDPTGWRYAPQPSQVVVRPGKGVDGTDRLELVWPDGAIMNQWLQVTMKADANTGLASPDVFYFGNAIGESGDSSGDAMVTVADEKAAANDPHNFRSPADVTNPHDYNRDGRVDATDQLIARSNATDFFTAVQLISPPAIPAQPALSSVASPSSSPSIDPHSRHGKPAPRHARPSLILRHHPTHPR